MPTTLLVLHRGGSQLRGSEEALLTLLRGLDPAELRPVVVCDQPVLRDEAARCGVEAHLRELPEILFDGADRRFPLLRWLRAVRALAALARGAELVLCSGGGPCQLGVPAAALARRPLVCLLHHPAPRRYHWLWLVRGASALVFTSRFTAEHTAAATGLRGPVVYAGIDAHRRFVPGGRAGSALRRALGYGDGDVVFAQVGALVPHKGHAVLLEAFAAVGREMPEARLLIVGGGPLEEEIRREVAERGLAGAVALTGYVPDADPCFREVMDVNVLASREEGLGLVNLQALACEVPCVATDGTGIRETVEHGRTGLLFPDGDAAALAAAMLRLGRSPGLRGEMGRAGRRRVLERFSHTACCASMRRSSWTTPRRGAAGRKPRGTPLPTLSFRRRGATGVARAPQLAHVRRVQHRAPGRVQPAPGADPAAARGACAAAARRVLTTAGAPPRRHATRPPPRAAA